MRHSRSYFGRNLVVFFVFGTLNGGGGDAPAAPPPLDPPLFKKNVYTKIHNLLKTVVCFGTLSENTAPWRIKGLYLS